MSTKVQEIRRLSDTLLVMVVQSVHSRQSFCYVSVSKVPKNIQGRSVLLQSPPAAPAPRVGNTVRRRYKLQHMNICQVFIAVQLLAKSFRY